MQRAIRSSVVSCPRLRLSFLLLALGAAACSRGGSGAPAKQPDGSYQLSCKGPLSNCLRHAEHVCGDEGYAVTSAHDVRELLGHAAGQSQVPIERSDANIVCGSGPERAAIRLQREEAPTPAPAPATAPAPAATAAPAPACVPGSTQACVGPAGCSGGQVCAADGARYEACDCGKPAP
jgi:hypothetical protein